MKTNRTYTELFSMIRDELCRECIQDPDKCTACYVLAIARDYAQAIIRGTGHTRGRIYYYSSRAVCPPAGYFVADIYSTGTCNRIALIAERQYKRALKNPYVQADEGIYYAYPIVVFIQTPNGALYRPSRNL